MKKLTILLGLTMALALALPGGANAAALVEVKKLTASDAQTQDLFGVGVAVSGDTAVVGAPFGGTAGIDGGAAYVFERSQGGPNNWGEVKKLLASDAQASDQFAFSVAVSGDAAIVGAIGEDAGGNSAGAAYVFERNEGGPDDWGEVTKLTASDAHVGDQFGRSVAISGDTAMVGARFEDAGGAEAGAAYVFERNEGGANNWGEVTKLTASDAHVGDQFGLGLAIDGDTAIVGAFREDAGGTDAGAAYVFERSQGGPDNWGEVKKLLASDAQAQDFFGLGVAISGDAAIVGATGEDAGGNSAGAAYVFQRNQGGPGTWGEVAKLTASDAQTDDFLGIGVAINGTIAIVGGPHDPAGVEAGAAYIFERNQGGTNSWGEVTNLTASDAQIGDQFGFDVAISGDTAIVGAYFEDAGGNFAGAAYVFEAQLGPKPTATPTPTPVPVGGLVVDLDEGPLAAAQPSGGSAGRLAGTVAGIAALAVALTGAAWYATRRLQ